MGVSRLREVVLVGGGHSHVQVLRMHAMDPLPGARVTVVVDRPDAAYSGMVPGFVAGQYQGWELDIDVRPLARRAGARIVVARATGIDTVARRVLLEGRPPLAFELCSLNTGSTVASQDLPGVREHALATRPIGRFVLRLDARLAELEGSAPRLVVVGAGAGGVELAFTLGQRLRSEGRQPQVTLVETGHEVLPRYPASIVRRVRRALEDRGVAVRCDARVEAIDGDAVYLAGAGSLPADLVVWVPGAVQPQWLARSGLPTMDHGFVATREDLQVEGHDGVFAVGDCATQRAWPDTPKAGVYAVRQGPVLMENLRRSLRGEPLRTYRPQGDFLTLLNLGDGTAIGGKWGLSFQGRWVFAWKDLIDRRFMERFQVLDGQGAPSVAFAEGMPTMEAEMVCGGCAAKVGEGPLHRALGRLPPVEDPEVLIGLETPEDVVVVARKQEVWVTSIDAFPAFTDDPWLVGHVAAANAVSDLHAKAVQPRFALALVCVPDNADPEETLFQVLAGARMTLDADGVTLLGGHTTIGPQLQVGFSVTGFAASADALLPKGGLRVGDALVLTRPLGTGVLWHADMAGRAAGAWVQSALEGMLRGNGPAAQVALAHELAASTDVTGFGLAGHLGEMLRASGCSATVVLDDVPLLDGVKVLLARGERSTFHEQNREALKGLRVAAVAAKDPRLEALFDPQTSGGLLLGVSPDALEGVLEALSAEGERPACIGRVTEMRADGAAFEVV